MQERMKVLEMLANGIISADEANELLQSMDKSKTTVQTEKGLKTVSETEVLRKELGKTLRIRVMSADGDKVNVNLPIAFIKAAIQSGTANQMFSKSIKINGVESSFINDSIDIDLILQCIENGVIGNIVDVESADGDIVQIYID